jgi:hypothetical protein
MNLKMKSLSHLLHLDKIIHIFLVYQKKSASHYNNF